MARRDWHRERTEVRATEKGEHRDQRGSSRFIRAQTEVVYSIRDNTWIVKNAHGRKQEEQVLNLRG